MAEIPALFAQRRIVNRHQKAALYHPFVEAMALTLVDIPITLATSITWSILVYFMVDLQSSAEQFLYVVILFRFGHGNDVDNHQASSCYSCSRRRYV